MREWRHLLALDLRFHFLCSDYGNDPPSEKGDVEGQELIEQSVWALFDYAVLFSRRRSTRHEESPDLGVVRRVKADYHDSVSVWTAHTARRYLLAEIAVPSKYRSR